MHTEIISGLHACKPGNEPQVGQIKTFVVQQMTGKSGKPYLKIKSANVENGGTPHRIVAFKPTGHTDSYGNISFNLEIEAVDGEEPEGGSSDTRNLTKARSVSSGSSHVPQAPPARPNGEDGVLTARKHLCQAANLYVLCVRCVNNMVAGELPQVAQTSEMFQAAVGTLFIQAARDGMVARMPDTPMKAEKPAPPPQDDDEEVPF